MSPEEIGAWGFFGLCLLVGVGCVFARVDEQEVQRLEALNRFFPAARLAKFRIYRYGAAIACFVLATVVYIERLS
jgi:hypothetical protein